MAQVKGLNKQPKWPVKEDFWEDILCRALRVLRNGVQKDSKATVIAVG